MTGAFKGLLSSFYSKRYYAELAYEQKGLGLGLTALLNIVLSFMFVATYFSGGVVTQIGAFVSNLPQYATSLPDIKTYNGTLWLSKPQPYKLNFGTLEHPAWILIDTNYKFPSPEKTEAYMRSNHVVLLANAYAAVIQGKGLIPDTTVIQFRDQHHYYYPFQFNQSAWRLSAITIKHYGMVFITTIFLCGLTLLELIGNFFSNLMIALVMSFLASRRGAGFGYSGCVRIAAAASIPYAIIIAIPMLFGGSMFFFGPLIDWPYWIFCNFLGYRAAVNTGRL